MKSLDQMTLESEKATHYLYQKYWLLENGKVGVDTVQERKVKSCIFQEEERNNCVTNVQSKIVDLTQCPAVVRTKFEPIYKKHLKRLKVKEAKVKELSQILT